jgi:hypothetical protein
MRINPETRATPLAFRAILALTGQEDPELIDEYLTSAIATLGELGVGLPVEEQVRLGQLQWFLHAFQTVFRPTQGTGSAVAFRRRPGRPPKSLADVMRRQVAVYLVNSLVANGWQKKAAVAEAVERLGLSRSEVFAWEKIFREGGPDPANLYPK